MGRLKLSENVKSKNVSISLTPRQIELVKEVRIKRKIDKISDMFQQLLEEEHYRLFGDKKEEN